MTEILKDYGHLHHEARLHCARHFVISSSTFAQEAVNLVDEDDSWLHLSCEAEECVNQLVGLSVPLIG